MCEPDLSPCLFECAKANEDTALYFDVRYQYPVGPVCDWPSEIDCINEPPPFCVVDEDCQDNEYCDQSGNCVIGCRNNAVCGECGECIDHLCKEPECCNDSDCQVIDFFCKEIKSHSCLLRMFILFWTTMQPPGVLQRQ